MQFEPFPKVPRLMRTISISEKIDGTNASIAISEGMSLFPAPDDPSIISQWLGDDGRLWHTMRAASRKRWIYPGKSSDNAGFAGWVLEHVEELKKLGPGHHFGEWWGLGIQRNYGLDEKRLSMFNPKWLVEGPDCVGVVPQLWVGEFGECNIEAALRKLKRLGSVAAPGFMNPEGIMIYHHAANQLFKYTLEGDGHKGN